MLSVGESAFVLFTHVLKRSRHAFKVGVEAIIKDAKFALLIF